MKEEEDRWQQERDKHIEIAKGFDPYKYSKDAGDKVFSPQPQYVRGGYLFTCPFCEQEISSHSYLYLRAWEDAAKDHIGKEHPDWRRSA